ECLVPTTFWSTVAAGLVATRGRCHPRAVPRRPPPAVLSRLPALLRRRSISWGELARRTLLPPRLLARLQASAANPRLGVAYRVAAALGVSVEQIWTVCHHPRCGGKARACDAPP